MIEEKDVNAIVMAVGVSSENELAASLGVGGEKDQVICIGDADQVSNGYHGIQNAYDLEQTIYKGNK